MTTILARADARGRVMPRWLNGHAYEWNPEDHPRNPAGSPEGGEFAPSGGELFHVTLTRNVEGIRRKGIIPFQPSHWVRAGDKTRYGEGDIYTFSNLLDAQRWAARMDWELHRKIGSGKVSIVRLKGGSPWEVDTADPLSQAGAKGKWLKRRQHVPARDIVSSEVFTAAMSKALVGTYEWDPEKHPRHPAGGERGGEFAPAQGPAENVSRGERLPEVVYRGGVDTNREVSQAWPSGVYVSTDANSASQWGGVRAWEMVKQPLLLDVGNWNAGAGKAIIGKLSGTKPADFTRDDFDEVAGTLFLQMPPEFVSALKRAGYDGARLGYDAFLIGKLSDYARPRKRYDWDESQHPRHPSGSDQGGEFAPAGGAAGSTSSPAEQELERAASSTPSHPEILNNLRKPEIQGMNGSGFVAIDGKEYFAKVESATEVRREVAAWEVAKELGWTDFVVPAKEATITVGDRTHHLVLQAVLPEGRALARVETINVDADRLQRMFLFEYAIGASDRHSGNFWADKQGNVYTIDHGLSFAGYKHAKSLISGDEAQEGNETWRGLWQRTAARRTIEQGIAREHIERVLAHADQIKAIAGRIDPSYDHYSESVSERMNNLRAALDKRIRLDTAAGKATTKLFMRDLMFPHELDGVTIRPAPQRAPLADRALARYGWDESQHPRHGAGSERGGEFAPAGGSTGTMSELFERVAAPDGGFTYQPLSHREPKAGFAVSLYPERSLVKPRAELSPADLASFVKANGEALKRRDHFVGAWHDPTSGKIYLDISVVTKRAASARKLARKYDQLAYFDLGKGASVRVDRPSTRSHSHERSTRAGHQGQADARRRRRAEAGRIAAAVRDADRAQGHARGNRSSTSDARRVALHPPKPTLVLAYADTIGRVAPILAVADGSGMVFEAGWDEDKHPRHPAGTSTGGQFAPAGGGAEGEPTRGRTGSGGRLRRTDDGLLVDEQGRFHVGDDVELGAKLLGEGKHIVLDQPQQVSTLLDRLSEIGMQELATKGEHKVYDLCKVSVVGSNLFCTESLGYERVVMPQLGGFPVPGSLADGLPRNAFGGVELGPMFVAHLSAMGRHVGVETLDASMMRATQRELDGAKVAAVANSFMEGKLPDERIVVSRDNYIVDGHHRWAAQVAVQYAANLAEVPIKVYRVDESIVDLLDEARKFSNRWGIPQKKIGAHRQYYDPDQPRHPAGTKEGGRFAPKGGGAAPASDEKAASGQRSPINLRQPVMVSQAETDDRFHARSERAFMIDQDTGNADEIGTPVSGGLAVNFSAEERVRLRGKVLTHNHPGDTALSNNDLAFASMVGLAEIRAIGTDFEGNRWLHRAYLDPATKHWPDHNRIYETYHLIHDTVKHGLDRQVKSGHLSKDAARVNLYEATNQQLAKELGYLYERIKL